MFGTRECCARDPVSGLFRLRDRGVSKIEKISLSRPNSTD